MKDIKRLKRGDKVKLIAEICCETCIGYINGRPAQWSDDGRYDNDEIMEWEKERREKDLPILTIYPGEGYYELDESDVGFIIYDDEGVGYILVKEYGKLRWAKIIPPEGGMIIPDDCP